MHNVYAVVVSCFVVALQKAIKNTFQVSCVVILCFHKSSVSILYFYEVFEANSNAVTEVLLVLSEELLQEKKEKVVTSAWSQIKAPFYPMMLWEYASNCDGFTFNEPCLMSHLFCL